MSQDLPSPDSLPPPDKPPRKPDRPGRRTNPKGGPYKVPPPPPPTSFDLLADAEAVAAAQAREDELAKARDRAFLKEGGLAPSTAAELRRYALECARRRIEGLRLYEPLPCQHAFHASRAQTRVLRGSNRGGKTLPAAVEIARAVTAQDPFDKYRKSDGRCFCVGKDSTHVGQVMWRKLTRAGAFKMIRDEVTGKWRAYRPWYAPDVRREHLVKPAPPLIPGRFIESVSWEKKNEDIPSVVKLRTGWELCFYSSLGKPPQGSDIDLWWFDEEIVDETWWPEMVARILDRRGCGIWSATPQAGTDQLYELHERAERERGLPAPSVEEFLILLAENPHIREEDKKAFAANLTEEENRVRVGGDFALMQYKIYPEFNLTIHGLDFQEIPQDWTRYAVVDPGHQVCAVLFAAVPPPGDELGDTLVLYDELYLRDCDAARFAEAMREKCDGVTMQAFVIDPNMAVYTEVAAGKSVGQQYTEALKAVNVASADTGSGFRLACDDVEAGILAVHGLLRVRQEGTPKLRVLRGVLPNFDYEIKRYHKKRVGGVITDKPDGRRNTHLMDCFDEATEVLTGGGWVPFSDVGYEDYLATVNLQTDVIEYQRPTELVARRHEGEMVRFSGRKLNAMVTPNHRMVVCPRSGNSHAIKLAGKVCPSDRLKLTAKWNGFDWDTIEIPACGRQGPPVEVDAGDWAEFLGWYVAEGSAATSIQMPGRGYQVVISQTKPEGKDRLRNLLGKLPWGFNEFCDGFRTNSCRQLWEQVSPLGDAYTKRIPEWVKGASPAIIERFLQGAIAGDGWKQGKCRVYATVSPRLADDIQELFLKIGRTASIRQVRRKDYEIRGHSGPCQVQYWVQEWTCLYGHLRTKNHKPNYSHVAYSGMVYCATVPNGTLIVRRGGKVLVAGNCLRYLALFGPRYVKPSRRDQKHGAAYAAFKAKQERMRKKHGTGFVNLGPGTGVPSMAGA